MVEQINTQPEREMRARTFLFDLTGAGGESSGADDVQFPAVADPILNVIYKLRGLSPSQDGGQSAEVGGAAALHDQGEAGSGQPGQGGQRRGG